MIDEKEVIRQAAIAANNHASDVSEALSVYIASDSAEALRFAERRLYRALVAQAEGHEATAANGATFSARRAAARAALEAWEGAAPEKEVRRAKA